MSLHRSMLLALVLVLTGSGAAAQEASPAAVLGGRLDLAAMALDRSDLPAGYRQRIYDDEGYTPGDRIAAIQFGGAVSAAEIAATGVAWFYSSTFQTEDGTGVIYIYLSEFPSESAVDAGFALFEDERRWTFAGEEYRDESGPVAGDAPKEITVGTYDDSTDPTRSEQSIDATFRVGRVLAGVAVIAFGEAPPPEPGLAEALAATLAERIAAVLAGRTPPGIDLALPGLILPLFTAWPWPGNSLEGHKDAEEFLGASGSPARFATEYRSGYAAFASAGSAAGGMIHDPPYLDVAVAEFASPVAALGVLNVVEELLQRHDGRPIARDPAPAPLLPGVDGVRAFRSERPSTGAVDSLHLIGSEVAFVLGSRFVIVSVLVDALDPLATPEQAAAVALDLAAQQADCLRAAGPCGPVRVPAELAGADVAPATPVT